MLEELATAELFTEMDVTTADSRTEPGAVVTTESSKAGEDARRQLLLLLDTLLQKTLTVLQTTR